jgi:tetratricopeptide (TPR) repeat protein
MRLTSIARRLTLTKFFMTRLIFLIACICFVLEARAFAAETNSTNSVSPPPDAISSALQNGLLQLQAQLRDLQLRLEDSRQAATAETSSNAAMLQAQIQSLEKTVADQHADEIQAARKTQQLTLFMAGVFGLAALGIMLLMVYFQWRAFSQLAEISARAPRVLPAVEPMSELAAPGRATVEASNVRLIGAVERLEKQVREMEQAARPALAEAAPGGAPAHKNGSSEVNDREECVANLLAEGQSLLDSNEPAKALECFDVALALQPNHAETLIKKGGALEKLERLDEAIACYDGAIAANGSMTIAYLQKGGLFNRMARYDDALKCYEQALQSQEKPAAVS